MTAKPNGNELLSQWRASGMGKREYWRMVSNRKTSVIEGRLCYNEVSEILPNAPSEVGRKVLAHRSDSPMAESILPPLKRCIKCGQEFPATPENFYRNRHDKSGFVSQCKDCHSKSSGYKTRGKPVDFAISGLPDGFKRCTACDVVYPATTEHFTRASRGMYGLDSRCKSCRKQYAEANADHIAKYHRTYYQTNHVYWRAKNRERYEQNKELVLEQTKRWHAENPEKTREAKRRWKRKHPELTNHYSRTRRARLLEVDSDFSYADWAHCLEHFEHKCAVCGRPADLWRRIVADHWYPIAKGGAHTATNIVPLCQEKPGCPVGESCCNSNKSAKDPIAWLNTFVGKRKAKVILARIQAYFDSLKDKEA